MPIISIIVAIAENNVIGVNNSLPWHLPADLRHFKTMTLGKPIIMGRNTFVSIGKALPGRRNIVVSRDPNFAAAGCETTTSLTSALALCDDCPEIMIIGGTQIFAEAFPLAHRLYITFIHQQFAGDSFFPHWDVQQWREISRQDYGVDDKNLYSYSFVTFKRNRQFSALP